MKRVPYLAGAIVCGILMVHISPEALGQTPRPARLFVFDDPFWLNLHHYLYVLGRVEAELPDSRRRAVAGASADQAGGLTALDEGEQRVWRTAVTTYAKGPSRRDVLFDGDMVSLGRTLIAAGDRTALDIKDIDPPIVATLRRAAPLYRKAWWPNHERANQALIARLESDLAKYGTPILAFIVRAYQEPWPAKGYPVNIAAYANWAGAYSNSAGVLVVSSLDPTANEGLKGLEAVFHEAMHQWDDRVFAALSAEVRRQNASVPDTLSHAMIFFTAGEAVRNVVPSHVPYAEAEGVWARGMGTLKPALESAWKPYLEGRGSRDEALTALVKAAAAPR
jgi:hypothetical protein